MTQKYYTKNLLPNYVRALHEARIRDSSRDWVLQEDHDPSHGTKSVDNVAQHFKVDNWICTLIHPAQSPDLNPQEGCWLILKECAKRRIHHPHKNEQHWDGSVRHLKQILREEWDKISLDQIRELISEMPWRCRRIIETEGHRIRSERW